MKIKLLPSTIDAEGCASPEQRLSCFVVDGRVCIDAGSIAIGLAEEERRAVRDVIITHPHMDHVATLPIFIDDLFTTLEQPVRVHATEEVIHLLERDIFNWTVYPRFSELKNEQTPVMTYVPFRHGEEFSVAHLSVTAVPVNHIVPTVGLIIGDGRATVGFSSDTAATEEFWRALNRLGRLDALLVESSFPNAMARLAEVSGHLTPDALSRELSKLRHKHLDILAVHLKPSYHRTLIKELEALRIPNLRPMEAGRDYVW